MKSAPLPAAPDLMTLLCLISRAMREIGPSPLLMQVLLIGAIRPQFGALLQTWLRVEERFEAAGGWGVAGEADDESGWLSQHGPVWQWRQVTQFGSVLVIPIVWFVEYQRAEWLKRRSVWVPGWALSPEVFSLFFLPVLAERSNCVLIVPVS